MADACTLRLAGLDREYPKTDREVDAEIMAIRRLIMEFGQHFLPDAFRNLRQLVNEHRLLIVERLEGGQSVIEGCIAYALQRLECVDPTTDEPMLQRVALLRLLAVRKSSHRSQIARRLALEAQLRATVRARYDNPDEPHAIGTLGVVLEQNARAIDWATSLQPRVRVLTPSAPEIESTPALAAMRRHAEALHAALGVDCGFRFVVIDRRNLVEAADLNLAGRQTRLPTDGRGMQYRYNPADPFQAWIEVAVANLARRSDVALARFGLNGPGQATCWGPPDVPQMTIKGFDSIGKFEELPKE